MPLVLFSVWTKLLLLIPQLVIWDFGLLNPLPTNKLLFFGRLCRSNSSTTQKLFHNLISQIILEEDGVENTITYDLIKTLLKYDMFSFLETFVHETCIPKKRFMVENCSSVNFNL